jgi:hypothetical protein
MVSAPVSPKPTPHSPTWCIALTPFQPNMDRSTAPRCLQGPAEPHGPHAAPHHKRGGARVCPPRVVWDCVGVPLPLGGQAQARQARKARQNGRRKARTPPPRREQGAARARSGGSYAVDGCTGYRCLIPRGPCRSAQVAHESRARIRSLRPIRLSTSTSTSTSHGGTASGCGVLHMERARRRQVCTPDKG